MSCHCIALEIVFTLVVYKWDTYREIEKGMLHLNICRRHWNSKHKWMLSIHFCHFAGNESVENPLTTTFDNNTIKLVLKGQLTDPDIISNPYDIKVSVSHGGTSSTTDNTISITAIVATLPTTKVCICFILLIIWQ